MPDVLLEVSRTLSKPVSPALPENYEAMLAGGVRGDSSTEAQIWQMRPRPMSGPRRKNKAVGGARYLRAERKRQRHPQPQVKRVAYAEPQL